MQLEKEKETREAAERCRLLAQRIAEELAPATAAVLNAETPALEKALHRAGVDANPFTVAARQADLLVVEDPAWVEMPAQLPGQVLLVFTGSNVAEGWAEELAKPKPYELKIMMIERAREQGTNLPEGAAGALLERCGEDPFLLENEVDKLCAVSGYKTVTTAMVAEMGTVSLEADVFEMIRMITAKNATGACKKLQTLLRLQQEPIAITAALIGSYVDLYRVKLGAAKRKPYGTVFKDFGYKGSDYRLKRSAETASHYTLGQIENCMQVLLELDQSLKSQPTDDQILLETALCRLAMAGSGR